VCVSVCVCVFVFVFVCSRMIELSFVRQTDLFGVCVAD